MAGQAKAQNAPFRLMAAPDGGWGRLSRAAEPLCITLDRKQQPPHRFVDSC